MSEESIFAEAIGKSIRERSAFLDVACGGDAELRQRVETLLKSHDGVGSFLAKPAAEDLGATMDLSTTAIHRIAAIPAETPVSTTPDLPMEEPGEKVLYFGDYELQVEIARGAMGVVYRAEQKSLKQTVAIKMIRSTMLSTDADVARFHAEAEAHTVAGMETPTKWGQEMAAAMNLSIRAIARARG